MSDNQSDNSDAWATPKPTMSDVTNRLKAIWVYHTDTQKKIDEAANKINKLRKEIALADSMYKLVVLERDAAREYLDAAQRRAESLRERVAVLEGALEGALKWGAALSPDEHAKCRAALKRED
jgi:hypothetical protein